MEVPSIAVTGVSGLVGQALVTRLAQESGVTRIVGLDVREPRRRTWALEFHLIDVARAELKPVLEGIDVLVHLASVVDPIPDEAMMARGQRRGHAALSSTPPARSVSARSCGCPAPRSTARGPTTRSR